MSVNYFRDKNEKKECQAKHCLVISLEFTLLVQLLDWDCGCVVPSLGIDSSSSFHSNSSELLQREFTSFLSIDQPHPSQHLAPELNSLPVVTSIQQGGNVSSPPSGRYLCSIGFIYWNFDRSRMVYRNVYDFEFDVYDLDVGGGEASVSEESVGDVGGVCGSVWLTDCLPYLMER